MEKHIYIFKTETNGCKIGVSGNIEQRKSTISLQGNNDIVDVFYTPKCFNAHEIESIMHKYFDKYRVISEWFNVDFQEACNKLSETFDKYAITEVEDNIKTYDYHSDKQQEDKIFNIYLSNDVINDLELSDAEVAVYIALRSIYTSMRNTQFVSYNMVAYELFGHSNYTNTAHQYITNGLNSLIKRDLVSVVKNLSRTEFELDMSKLFFDFDADGEYYTVIKRDEVHKIMNIKNKMDKFKLLRYFTTCLRTLCRTQGNDIKKGIVGFMTQEYLCNLIGVSHDTNSKLIQTYNSILEENKLLFIYRHTEMKRDKKTGQIKSFANHYGRYEDKDDIEIFALNYEKTCGVQEEIVRSDKSNQRRRLSSQYNNLCYDFDRYVDVYSDKELIEIYKYIHFKNDEIEKELETAKEGTEYYDRLLDKLKDEDLFDDIPCVVEYINEKM